MGSNFASLGHSSVDAPAPADPVHLIHSTATPGPSRRYADSDGGEHDGPWMNPADLVPGAPASTPAPVADVNAGGMKYAHDVTGGGGGGVGISMVMKGPPVHASPSTRPVVLVVDDEAIVRRIMVRLLHAMGVEAVCAKHGGEALAACHVDVDVTVVHDTDSPSPPMLRTPFDAVFMDINMPLVDGYAATATLRKAGAVARERDAEPTGGAAASPSASLHRLPIVAMTANVLAGDRERALRLGMDDYLAKPVTLPALRRCLHAAGVAIAPPSGNTTTPPLPQGVGVSAVGDSSP
jgi:CheY-like chemotaxis protein